MSARKNVNQSRPRALACGVALAVAGAVCFNAASDGRPTLARRSSRPPSNSSASVDSPLSPAPSGNYGVGIWSNAPRIRPPSPLPISTNLRVSECARRYSNRRKAAILRMCCEFRKQKPHGTKFQSSAILSHRACGRTNAQAIAAPLLAVHLVFNKRRSRPSANIHRLTSSGRCAQSERAAWPIAKTTPLRVDYFRSRTEAIDLI